MCLPCPPSVGAAPLCLPPTNQGNHEGIAPTIIGKFFGITLSGLLASLVLG
jgi:hypothetical protein